MNFVKKRETPTQNIAYIGIMSAINLIFVLLSNLLPILFLLLVFILPLTTVIVTLLCKKYYLPIYFVVTILLCFTINLGFGIYDTFIYVVPAMITGIMFGIMIEKQVPAILVLLGTSIVQFILTYLTFFIISNYITNINFYESLYSLFGLSDFTFKPALIVVFTYLIAQIQISLTYILVKYEVNRIGIDVNLSFNNRYIIYFPVIISGVLSILSYYFFRDWSLLFTLIIIPVVVYELIQLTISKYIWIYISLAIAFVISVFLFAYLYQYVVAPNQLILINIFFAAITIIDILSNYCFKDKGKKIK